MYRPSFINVICAAVSLVLFGVVLAFAQDEEVGLEKIVVTPYRYAETLTNIASSVTVITPIEIKNSNAEKVVDVLRSIPGVVVRDLYGNGNSAVVDIAGFGEQAALNVLVLIDGRRTNDVDLSGVDWSQIPLDQVERIEVVRGGSGGVLYGDNASSGVINIITKKGSGKPKVNLEAQYGSYDMNAQKLSLGGEIDNKFSYWFGGGREATHGYRNNTFNKASDFASKLAYDFNDRLSMHFSSGLHSSTFGLPASLNQSVIDQFNRRYARNGDDHVNDKDNYYVLGTKADFRGAGCFDIDFSYRRKKSDLYSLTSAIPFATTAGIKKNMIKTFGVTPKYTLGNSIFNQDNKLIIGSDYYRADFDSKNYAMSNNSLQDLTGIKKTSFAGYLQDEFSIFKQLVLVAGYRYEVARYAFGYHDNANFNPDQDKKVQLKQRVFNAGLVYTYQEDSNVFLNVGKGFRFPEVDEFAFYDDSYKQQLNTNLKQQSAMNYQLGIRHKFSDRSYGSFSLFRMDVKDELLFNNINGALGWTGQNENYDRTIHEGLESSFDLKLRDWFFSFANYAFTNAIFDAGEHDKNEIPLVPRHKGSVGLRFLFPKSIVLNVTGTYVGARYFLNDQANAYSRLNAYMVLDTNLSWHYKDAVVTLGINNVLNKQYSEVAGVTLFNGVKFYYPSPKRNFILKVDYTF